MPNYDLRDEKGNIKGRLVEENPIVAAARSGGGYNPSWRDRATTRLDEKYGGYALIFGAVAGFLLGGYFGSSIGGTGGAILFGVISAIVGAIAAYLILLSLPTILMGILIVAGIIAAIAFIVSLWGK